MDPLTIAAVGGLAVNAISNIAGGLSSKSVAEKNLSQQQKNLDYQKHVQEQTWQREDTAIQRRKADLQAAGFNPWIAAGGNGANSGSIVSTQAPQNQFNPQPYYQAFGNAVQQMPGAAVDMLKALEQYKQDKLYTSYMQMRNSEQAMYNTDMNYYLMNNYGWLDENGDMHTLYFPTDSFYFNKDQFSRYKQYSLAWQNRKAEYGNSKFDFDSLPYRWNMFQNDVLMSDYNKDLLKVKRDFAVSDKIEQYILDSIGALTGVSNTARGWYDSYKKVHTPPRVQNYRERNY